VPETAALRLGFDIGGSKLALALGDAEGRILARARRPSELSGDARADVKRMIDDALGLLRDAGHSVADLAAVGAAVPGPFDPRSGRVLNPPNMPGWRDVPVRDWLQQELGCRVFLENDANAAAVAEAHHGAGRGAASCIYLTMSTGVGAGLVLDGRLYRGAGAGAGELGHVAVEWGGEPCACGLRGCLEAYVGGAAWTARLRRETPATSRVAELAELAGGPEQVRPEHVVAAAREGDAFALAEFARFNDYLARAIVQISFIFDPDVIVLGTIPTAAGEQLCFEPVRARARAHLWPEYADRLRVVPAALADELPYRAALCAAELGLKASDSVSRSSG
jgi:glucokinase